MVLMHFSRHAALPIRRLFFGLSRLQLKRNSAPAARSRNAAVLAFRPHLLEQIDRHLLRREAMPTSIIRRLDEALVENAADGLYRCDRTIFTDAELFELEMKHLFEGNWIFLAHESQIPNKDDYF